MSDFLFWKLGTLHIIIKPVLFKSSVLAGSHPIEFSMQVWLNFMGCHSKDDLIFRVLGCYSGLLHCVLPETKLKTYIIRHIIIQFSNICHIDSFSLTWITQGFALDFIHRFKNPFHQFFPLAKPLLDGWVTSSYCWVVVSKS